MSDDPNIFDPGPWEHEFGPARGSRLGAQAGSQQLGATLYEVDAGAQAAPYHVHHGNEELLIVLEGELELRTPGGLRTVPAGAVVAFVSGTDGAHRVRNVSQARARYLVVSTMHFPDVAEQLATGTVLALKGPADGWAFGPGAAGDYVQLTMAALEAEQDR